MTNYTKYQVPNSNYLVLSKGLILAYTQKAGSTSIIKATRRKTIKTFISQDEVLERKQRDDAQVVMFIREPMARFESVYRFLTDPECPLYRSAPPMQGMSLDNFINAILRQENQHWNPQLASHKYYYLGAVGFTEQLLDYVYPFERIDELWEEVTGLSGPFPHERKAPKPYQAMGQYSLSYSQQSLLMEKYREDIELHHKAVKYGKARAF